MSLRFLWLSELIFNLVLLFFCSFAALEQQTISSLLLDACASIPFLVTLAVEKPREAAASIHWLWTGAEAGRSRDPTTGSPPQSSAAALSCRGTANRQAENQQTEARKKQKGKKAARRRKKGGEKEEKKTEANKAPSINIIQHIKPSMDKPPEGTNLSQEPMHDAHEPQSMPGWIELTIKHPESTQFWIEQNLLAWIWVGEAEVEVPVPGTTVTRLEVAPGVLQRHRALFQFLGQPVDQACRREASRESNGNDKTRRNGGRE
ncbi:hypothetical protein BDV93DRAFT_513751 [Ceratobasidium sp. AG-I]|nr:hypothetical protein BDV93DRAFT_513751 [Ceratobasidium sp. AG-I]